MILYRLKSKTMWDLYSFILNEQSHAEICFYIFFW